MTLLRIERRQNMTLVNALKSVKRSAEKFGFAAKSQHFETHGLVSQI
jgi:hypothetical protein